MKEGKCLTTHNPANVSLNQFTEEVKKCGVTLRVSTEDTLLVEKGGTHVLDCTVEDVVPSSSQIIVDPLSLNN